eukprot:m.771329 g.771329  ORF g.771329 m.771329 type:complete len:153 (-) comp23244_c0_seq29:846-1304(-)
MLEVVVDVPFLVWSLTVWWIICDAGRSRSCTHVACLVHNYSGSHGRVLPVDDALSQKADLLDVLETGRCHTLGTSLTLHVRRDALHATLVVKNGGKHLVETLLDCTKSRNVISNRPSLKVPARIPAGGAVLLCHLLPARATAPWSVECTIAS